MNIIMLRSYWPSVTAVRTNDGIDARVLVALDWAAMRTDDIHNRPPFWLFWSDPLTCLFGWSHA